jgi:hypothetical protein
MVRKRPSQLVIKNESGDLDDKLEVKETKIIPR